MKRFGAATQMAALALVCCGTVVPCPAVLARPLDGFYVSSRPYPTTAVYPVPSKVLQPVSLDVIGGGKNAHPVSPYILSQALFSKPYIAIQSGGSVHFAYLKPMRYFQLLWGTIDGLNYIDFYAAHDHLIGTLSGKDVLTAFNLNAGSRRGMAYEANVVIRSKILIQKVVLRSGDDDFEIANVSAAN